MNEKLELLLLLLLSSHVCLHSQTVSALNVDWVRVYQLKYTTYFLLCGQCMNTHHGQSEPSARILDSKERKMNNPKIAIRLYQIGALKKI